MKISTILDTIDLGTMALPEFQRPYVWNREQVRHLMNSLYRRHPVGSLLVWQTKAEGVKMKGDAATPYATVDLLLDGQQRITSLYGIFRGKPPKFFEGDESSFKGLHFNLHDETFEFYSPLKMKDNPAWVDVTALMQGGMEPFVGKFATLPDYQSGLAFFLSRLTKVQGIGDVDLHIELVSGDDKTVDVVVDIFNQVNSGGTKLSKGDLALARMCARWPEARDQLRQRLRKWEKSGFHFTMDWFLRNVNAVVTGESLFLALDNVSVDSFADGVKQAEKQVDWLLNLIAGRLGLDHDRVLGSRYALPVMSRYLHQRGGSLSDFKEQGKLLYWYVQALMWGRYSGSTESVMNQDLHLIEQVEGGLDRLIAQLRQNRGNLAVTPEDFSGWSSGARFYPLLYMLTRVHQARDWGTGLPLNATALGAGGQLHLHHIFPKAQLYSRGHRKDSVNALANYCFQTLPTNVKLSDTLPSKYMHDVQLRLPGALESQWIPTDPDLWRIERYEDFLSERRSLLAEAANSFLDGLVSGKAQASAPVAMVAGVRFPGAKLPGSTQSEEEENILAQVDYWVAKHGLPHGEISLEVTDPVTERPCGILDLAWPDGLQPGLSQPVALLLDEPAETLEAANRAGYLYFTDTSSFKQYVENKVLALGVGDEAVA